MAERRNCKSVIKCSFETTGKWHIFNCMHRAQSLPNKGCTRPLAGDLMLALVAKICVLRGLGVVVSTQVCARLNTRIYNEGWQCFAIGDKGSGCTRSQSKSHLPRDITCATTKENARIRTGTITRCG